MRKISKAAAILLSIVISLGLFGCGEKESAYFLEETVSAPEGVSVQAAEIHNTETTREGQVFGQDCSKTGFSETQETDQAVFFVYVCGAVQNPGVYELAEGSRIFEAIELAGGFREDACKDYINQAQAVSDAMKIYIPTVEEIKNGEFHGEAGENGPDSAPEVSLVNINTADIDKLLTLPGIGESRAEAIITYREDHGKFEKIEDIMQVSGIKEGAFKKIKDKICVN